MPDATEIEVLRTALADSSAISDRATGGVYVDIDAPGTGPPLGPKLTPPAYGDGGDPKALKPCIVVSELIGDEGPDGAGEEAETIFVRIGFYQRIGYRVIRELRAATAALLDPEGTGKVFGPTSDGRYFIVRRMPDLPRRQTDDGIESSKTIGGAVSYEAQQYRVETDRPTIV